MGVVAVLVAACVALTVLLSRTWGKVLTRKNRRIAVWCCGLAVPVLVVVGAGIQLAIATSGPPPTVLNDSPPFGIVLLFLAALALPFTVVTSEIATPRVSSKNQGF
jgi:hypothetical protein